MDTVEEDARARDWLDWVILGLKCCLWLLGQIYFVSVEFGAVFFLFSCLAFIYYNMGEKKRR